MVDSTNQTVHQSLGAQQAHAAHRAKPKASNTDHIMYQAFMGYVKGLGITEDMSTGLAKMATALYKNMLPNSIDKLKALQKELGGRTYIENNWSAWTSYESQHDKILASQGQAAADQYSNSHSSELKGLPEGTSIQDLRSYYNEAGTGDIDAFKASTNDVGQEINQETVDVQNSKQLADMYQSQVGNATASATEAAAQIGGFLNLMKQPFKTRW